MRRDIEPEPGDEAEEPQLDTDEGADVMEARKDAKKAQREAPTGRAEEDIINLDPSD